MGLLIASPATAQNQLEPLSDHDFQRITQATQSCFSDAVTVSQARLCLDIPNRMVDVILNCADAMTTIEMTYCSVEVANVLDAILNAEYRISIEIVRSQDASGLVTEEWDPVSETNVAYSYEESLRVAQRVWLDFRDANCVAHIGPNTGYQGYSIAISGCYSSMITERIIDLVLMRMGIYGIGIYGADEFDYGEFGRPTR